MSGYGLNGVYFHGQCSYRLISTALSIHNNTVYYLPGTTGWSSTFAGGPAILWNPVIQTGDGSFGVQNNQFGFNITGTNNFTFVVEACIEFS